jgi:hypothetical protein
LYVDTLGVDTVWKWAVLLAFDRNPQSWNEQRAACRSSFPYNSNTHKQYHGQHWSPCGLNQ